MAGNGIRKLRNYNEKAFHTTFNIADSWMLK